MSKDLGIGDLSSEDCSIVNIIKERKAERKRIAKQKCQVDLQRIKDMKSITGIHPLELFPRLVWEQIIEELDPEELENLWQLHPFFRGLIKCSRVGDILFPLVLKVNEFQQSLGQQGISTTDARERREELLLLRCISRSTRRAIDSSIDRDLKKHIEGMCDRHEVVGIDFKGMSLRLSDAYERRLLERFLWNLAEEDGLISAKNFFPRTFTLSIAIGTDEINLVENEVLNLPPEAQFSKNILKLLEAIGERIWCFNLTVEKSFTEAANVAFRDAYLILHRCLSLTPNLKWLKVSIDHLFQEELAGAKSVAEENPLPGLTQLERLSLQRGIETDDKRTSFYIHTLLLGFKKHNIKMLEFGTKSMIREDRFQYLYILHYPFLRSQIFPTTSLQTLQSNINCKWPLQNIVLRLHPDENTNASVLSVFQFLEHFPTLEKMDLFLNEFCIRDTHNLSYIKLPNLTDFRLELYHPEVEYKSSTHFFSLQFLLLCKKLKNISYLRYFKKSDNAPNINSQLRKALLKYEKENFGNVIDFRVGLRNLRDSNIWQIFPYLNILRVENVVWGSFFGCQHEYWRADLEDMSDSEEDNLFLLWRFRQLCSTTRNWQFNKSIKFACSS